MPGSFLLLLRAAQIYNEAIISYLGIMGYPDLAAEMADMLLRLEGNEWVLCMGVYQDELILAVRTRSRQGGAGRLAQAVVGNQGAADSHVPLYGRDPKPLVCRLGKLALLYLNISPVDKGKRLI